jgi:hypothetical protein
MKVAKFGHVQRQPGRVEPELGDHAAGKPGLDLAQLPLAEAVYRVPEPTVINRGPVQPHHRGVAIRTCGEATAIQEGLRRLSRSGMNADLRGAESACRAD